MNASDWDNTELYKDNYTFLLFEGTLYYNEYGEGTIIKNIKKTDPKFFKQYFKTIQKESKFTRSGTYDVIGFNQNQFKKELKKYLYQISKNPILEESLSNLDVSKDDFIAFSEWSLKLYVSNEILIQVYENYFRLIRGQVCGRLTWVYFKQPLTLNFIQDKVLFDGENYRQIMFNSPYDKNINQRLWYELYRNSIGIYTDDYTEKNLKADSYPNIDNSMRFIQKFRDELDWAIVQLLYPINFTIEFLWRYRDYLVFHHYDMWLYKGKVCYDEHTVVHEKNLDLYTYKDSKGIMEITNGGEMEKPYSDPSTYYNRKGKKFKGASSGNNVIIKRSDKIAISESNNVIWSSELLIKLKDYFSWHLLSINEALPWSLELLIAFRDKWDFKALSSNKAIRWTYEAIKEFENELCFETLSANTNVDWDKVPYLNDFYKKKWDWNVISNNIGINEDFVNRYQTQIIFADSREGYNWSNLMMAGPYKKIMYGKQIPNFANNSIMKPKLSLSTNDGLVWTDSLFQTYLKKLDFWLIALMGKIDSNLVMKYAGFFNESRQIRTYRQKNSDWPSIEVHVFSSGWQNLKLNPNFHPSDEFINFSKTYSTRIYNSYYDDTGPYHKMRGFIDPHISSKFEEVTVYSIFKNKNR